MCFGGMNALNKVHIGICFCKKLQRNIREKKAIYIILKECQSSQHSFVSFEKLKIESKCRGTASRTHCKVLHIIIIIIIEKWHKNRDFQIEFNKI